MMQPSFAEFSRLAKQGNLIPVYDVFSADLLTPVSAYLRIAQGARYSFLLESVEGGEKIARYTFAGAHPEEVFRYNAGACVMESPIVLSGKSVTPFPSYANASSAFSPFAFPDFRRSSLAPSVISPMIWCGSSNACPSGCATKSGCTTPCSLSITA